MKNNIISVLALSLLLLIGLFSFGSKVSAETAGTAVPVTVTNEAKLLDRGNKEIDIRISSLTDMKARIEAMKKLTATQKAGYSEKIDSEISRLNTLKLKIAADSDKETLKLDVASITKSFRIFALIEPQLRITSAGDRVIEIVGILRTIHSKLSARVSDAVLGSQDVSTLQTALSDMSAKLTNAQTQAQAAINGVVGLSPDNGVASVMQSNKQALANARKALKTATQDLQTARDDARKIIDGLKAIKK